MGFYDLAKLTLKAWCNQHLTAQSWYCSITSEYRVVVTSLMYPHIQQSIILEIPVYSPNKVDLGGLEPDGTFELSDCLDFRPVVGQIIGSTTFGTNNSQDPSSPVDISNSTSGAVYAPFGYESGRSFLGARSWYLRNKC